MTKTEKQKWRDTKTIAVYYMGLVGLNIKYIEYGIDDYIIYIYTGDNSIHKSKIYITNETSYFIFSGHRVKLNECISVF